MLPLEVLLNQLAARACAKHGSVSRLQQVERIGPLPMAKQRFVLEMLETVLAQASG